MPRHLRGPFPAFVGLSVVDPIIDVPGVVDARVALLANVLRSDGCQENGTAVGKVCDRGWDHDLREFVRRSVPHDIIGNDATGSRVVTSVSVKLDTLRAEVDDNNEVCAWIYEES